MKTTSESGFTLIELAIVVTIIGFLMGGAMMMAEPLIHNAQYNTTKKKLDNLANVLSSYAQTYGRLPCPASPNPTIEPYGAPKNSGANGTNLNVDCIAGLGQADFIGIVPFRALGLDEGAVTDGYGNLITYAVSPILAGHPPTSAPVLNKVHAQCRTQAWNDGTGRNKNWLKANLCCPPFSTDLGDIDVREVIPPHPLVYSGQHSTTTSDYGTNTQFLTATDPPPPMTSRLIAFVLVSHGENGEGAFISHSNNITPSTLSNSSAEAQNRNTGGGRNLWYYYRPGGLTQSSTNDADYFDDLVMWRTNDQVVSAFGDSGCAKP